jgi:hypothetical protein
MVTRESPTLRRMRKRLEQMELDHLRALCAEQAERIESLERDLASARDEAHNASVIGEMWHEMATSPGSTAAMTPDGQLFVVRQ